MASPTTLTINHELYDKAPLVINRRYVIDPNKSHQPMMEALEESAKAALDFESERLAPAEPMKFLEIAAPGQAEFENATVGESFHSKSGSVTAAFSAELQTQSIVDGNINMKALLDSLAEQVSDLTKQSEQMQKKQQEHDQAHDRAHQEREQERQKHEQERQKHEQERQKHEQVLRDHEQMFAKLLPKRSDVYSIHRRNLIDEAQAQLALRLGVSSDHNIYNASLAWRQSIPRGSDKERVAHLKTSIEKSGSNDASLQALLNKPGSLQILVGKNGRMTGNIAAHPEGLTREAYEDAIYDIPNNRGAWADFLGVLNLVREEPCAEEPHAENE